MKVVVRNILVCFLILSPAPCRAVSPTYSHDFNAMWNDKTLEVVNHTGTSTADDIVYTCSSGAQFFLSSDTDLELAIFLVASGAQVVISKIQNLDSISITFTPSYSKSYPDVFTFEILEDGDSEWKTVTTTYQTTTLRTLKLPKVGDYSLRITKRSTNVYIKEIDYTCLDPLSGCPNCFIYKPE